MNVVEQARRLGVRVVRDKTTPTPDWLERVKNYHRGLIKDDRVTCNECSNNTNGQCRERLAVLEIKQRCIKFLNLKGDQQC